MCVCSFFMSNIEIYVWRYKPSPVLVLFNIEEEFVDSGEESDIEADEHSQYPDEVPYPSARMERSSQELSGLPSTVEVLSTHDGCRVYLVGTAHFSESSQQDVTKVRFFVVEKL